MSSRFRRREHVFHRNGRARFITERGDLHAVSQWLSANGWTVVTSEWVTSRKTPELTEENKPGWRISPGVEDHDDVHRAGCDKCADSMSDELDQIIIADAAASAAEQQPRRRGIFACGAGRNATRHRSPIARIAAPL